MTRAPRWPAAIGLSAAMLGALALAGAAAPLRLPVALWLLIVCTGMAWVPLMPVDGLSARLALAIALSLAIDTLAVTALLVADAFSPVSAALALGAVCAAGCVLQLRRWAGTPGRTEIRMYER